VLQSHLTPDLFLCNQCAGEDLLTEIVEAAISF